MIAGITPYVKHELRIVQDSNEVEITSDINSVRELFKLIDIYHLKYDMDISYYCTVDRTFLYIHRLYDDASIDLYKKYENNAGISLKKIRQYISNIELVAPLVGANNRRD